MILVVFASSELRARREFERYVYVTIWWFTFRFENA